MDTPASPSDSNAAAKRRRPAPIPPDTEILSPLETWPARGDVTESHPAWASGASATPAEVQVIVRVTEEGYVPDCVQVRARISELLFTAELSAAALPTLAEDPRVASVGPPRVVHTAKTG